MINIIELWTFGEIQRDERKLHLIQWLVFWAPDSSLSFSFALLHSVQLDLYLSLKSYCICCNIVSGLCFGALATRHVGSWLLTRDRTYTPYTGRRSPNHWAARKVPEFISWSLKYSTFHKHVSVWQGGLYSNFNNFIVCWTNIQTLANFDLCTGVTCNPQTNILLCFFWFFKPVLLHNSCSSQLLIWFHHNILFEIHENFYLSRDVVYSAIPDPSPQLTCVMRKAATLPPPSSARIVVVNCTRLVNGLRPPPSSHFRPDGIHIVWQEVLYLFLQVCLKSSSDY